MTDDHPMVDANATTIGQSEGGDRSLASRLVWLASAIHSDRVGRGGRAELRRMREDGIPPEVYWTLTGQLEPVPGERDDSYWMTVMALMTWHPHARGVQPGRALAGAGVKPSRAERWLRRDKPDAWREARRVLSPLRGEGFDWGRFGTLLYWWDQPKERRAFARDFFRAAAVISRSEPTSDEGNS